MSLIRAFCLRRCHGRWFYNEAMTQSPLYASAVALLSLCMAGACLAQSPVPAAEQPVERKIERIRIDELRVGGETQSITVSPKGGMPVYEVLPASANRAPSAGERGSASGSGGTRVWKVLGF
jgi:hypothetical protein